MAQEITFIAELVFEKFAGWCFIEPHIFVASHPEIAYDLALARGREGRGDKRFAGLADLRVKTDDSPLFGRLKKGDARDLAVTKERLSAFQNLSGIDIASDSGD